MKIFVKLLIQYTLANPNRGVSTQKISVRISEFVRISEVIHLYGRRNVSFMYKHKYYMEQSILWYYKI